MYNMKLKDYTLSLAREMIHRDQESWADDYLANRKVGSWMSFIADPGLTFYLIGEGRVRYRATLVEVLADQFSWLKIDLALAHALAMKSGFDSPDPESTEIALRLGRLLSGIVVMDLSPRCGMSPAEQRNQLFKIYQTRRRLRYTFRGIDPTSYSHQFLFDSLDKITSDLDVITAFSVWPLGDNEADDAIHSFVGWLEEKGDAGPGDFLRTVLYGRDLIYDGDYDI